MRISIWLILSVFGFGALGQGPNTIDSLNRLINTALPDSQKVEALCALSKELSGTDNDKALKTAQRALVIANKVGYSKWVAYSYNRIGSVYDFMSSADSAQHYYLKALKLFEATGDKSGVAACYQNIAVMYYYQLDFDKAIEYNNKALPLRFETGELNYVAKIYNNLGAIYRRQKKYREALSIYNASLKLKEGQGDKRGVAACYLNIGTVYRFTGNFDSALVYINKSLEADKTAGSPYDLASDYIGRGDLLISAGKTREARADIAEGIALAKKIKSPDLLYNAYGSLVACDSLEGNYKAALYNHLLMIQYKDEVLNAKKTAQVEKLQALYESEKKDSEIQMLNLDNDAKEKQQRLLLAALLLFVALLILAVWAFFSVQKRNKVLARQKREIEEKTEQLKKQAIEIARLSSQMNPHFLFNALSSLQKFVFSKDEEKSLEYINQLSALLRQTLNNSVNEYIGLDEEIKYIGLYLQFEETLLGPDFSFSISAEGIDAANVRIPPMLIQPIAENSVKHGLINKSGGKTISITVVAEGQLLKITIQDNGIGRTAAQEQKNHTSKALQITESRLRAEFEKAQLACETPLRVFDLKEATGTKVVLLLPFLEDF